MNVVGIMEDEKAFESQTYSMDEEKIAIQAAIIEDAKKANVTIEIAYMTNNELLQYIEAH